MLLFEASIVIEVWDADPAPHVPQHVTGEAEGGRELLIVAALSAEWDWFPAPQGGKVVRAGDPATPVNRSRPATTITARPSHQGTPGQCHR